MRHILVAYDVSEQAEKAFNFAIELAFKFQAKLTVLAVAPTIKISFETETDDALKSSFTNYNNSFVHLRTKAEQRFPSVPIDFKIVDGVPAEEIINYAESLGVDHIVMGHRGLSGFKRWLMGSVAKQVMLYAHCAITIVR